MAAPLKNKNIAMDVDTFDAKSSISDVKSSPPISKDLLHTSKSKGNAVFIIDKPKQQKMETFKLPPSSVLAKVRSFLPQMEMANKSLEEQISSEGSSACNIEDVDDEEQHIEMNIAVVEGLESDSDEDSEDSDSSCEENNEPLFKEITETSINLSPASTKNKNAAKIEIIDAKCTEHSLGSKNIKDNCEQKNG